MMMMMDLCQIVSSGGDNIGSRFVEDETKREKLDDKNSSLVVPDTKEA